MDAALSVVLACAAVAGLGACRGPDGRASPPVRQPPSVEVPRTEAVSNESRSSAAPRLTLPAADCRAFRDARALAVAVVATNEPDCSSVGHSRIVLEVKQLVRGEGVERVVTSRMLGSSSEPALEIGDIVVVAIEPAERPAETVYCVALPAHQGSVRHLLKVGSSDDALQILGALAASERCAP